MEKPNDMIRNPEKTQLHDANGNSWANLML